MTLNKKYRVGIISIDADGTWWVDWAGTNPDGGTRPGGTNLGTADLEWLLGHVGKDMLKWKSDYLEAIQDKENKDKTSDPNVQNPET